MEFNYVGYNEDILENIFAEYEGIEDTVFIFENDGIKREAEKYYKSLFSFENNILLTVSELKEYSFLDDGVLLREEKQILAFYEVLSKKEKDILNIKNYYDVIDIANNFFILFKEFSEEEVDFENIPLEKNQKELFSIFLSINSKYKKFLKEKGLSDIIFLNNMENFNINFWKNYKKFIFINKTYFSNLEKSLLTILKGHKKNIFNYLQLSQESFDQENLCLKKVDFSKSFKKNIKFYEIPNNFLELTNMLKLIDEEKKDFTILDANFENQSYADMLSFEKFSISQNTTLKDSKIFSFLSNLHEILKSLEFINGQYLIKASAVLNSIYNKDFRAYYKINDGVFYDILSCIKEGYKYFSIELIEKLTKEENENKKNLASLKILIDEVLEIQKIKNLGDFISYVSNFNFKFFKEHRYSNLFEMYFSCISEIQSIEKLNIVKSWGPYFESSKKSEGFFRLFLKYLRFKKVDFAVNKGSIKIMDFKSYPLKNNENLIFLNITEGILPEKSKGSFLFTEKQRKEMGLKSLELSYLETRYKFFRNVFSAKSSIVFSLKNLDKNIEISSFVEELKLNYNLKTSKSNINEEHYLELTNLIFENNSYFLTEERDNLLFDKEDLRAGKLALGYYDYKTLKDCFYKFYLRKILKVEAEPDNVDYKFEMNILGILVHNLIDSILEHKKTDFLSGNFSIDYSLINEKLDEQLWKIKFKLPNNYKLYYEKIVFPAICKSIFSLYNYSIPKILSGENIKDVFIEKTSKDKIIIDDDIKVVIHGIPDLIIETDKNKYIIDFKTGIAEEDQLSFYELIFYGESSAKKYFYKIFDDGEKMIEAKSNLTEEEIRKLMIEFLIEGVKSNICGRCNYQDMSRKDG